MKLSAQGWRLLIFLAFALLALCVFVLAPDMLTAFAGFFVCALLGIIMGNRMFNRRASIEEKRSDLEDRTRNTP